MPVHDTLYNRIREPLLVVISGPSGVGKDSVISELHAHHTEPLHFVVTATTRSPREGEIHGQDYFFLSNDEFAEMIDNDELLEYAIVYNDYKGIPKQQVREALASGKDVIMRIDVQGAATIREICPDALLIFMMTENEDSLVRRLTNRKSETPEGLRLRIATARKEMERIVEFDYYVVNYEDRLGEAAQRVRDIIHAEHQRVQPRKVRL